MGIFFEKRESTKPFKIIRFLLIIVTIVLFIVAISSGFDFFYLGILFMLVGVSNTLDGIESYLKKENKWRYISEFGFAILWVISSVILLK
jgi:hypothetical protein